MAYLYRHSLELKLKNLIDLGVELTVIEKTDKLIEDLGGHNLAKPWNPAKPSALPMADVGPDAAARCRASHLRIPPNGPEWPNIPVPDEQGRTVPPAPDATGDDRPREPPDDDGRHVLVSGRLRVGTRG